VDEARGWEPGNIAGASNLIVKPVKRRAFGGRAADVKLRGDNVVGVCGETKTQERTNDEQRREIVD
jgi:hypothetical protein